MQITATEMRLVIQSLPEQYIIILAVDGGHAAENQGKISHRNIILPVFSIMSKPSLY